MTLLVEYKHSSYCRIVVLVFRNLRERDRGLISKAKDIYKTKDKGIIEVRVTILSNRVLAVRRVR